jgi:DHA2 family metal-tetracycline-proton antiporter-like MFS transporter
VTIFFIFFAMGSVIYGKLSDIYSVRKLIVIGIVIYNVGSILGFITQSSYSMVIVCRAIQGAGASAIPALVMVLIARYFSTAERGRIFGMISSTVAFGIGVGPVLGGFVSGTYHWAYLFFISLFTLISVPFFRKMLPDEPKREGTLDIPGAFIIGIGIAALILYLTDSRWYYLATFVVLLVWFTFHIRRVKDPFIEPSLFAHSLFRNGLLISFIIFCTVMGVMFIIPLMLSKVFLLSTNTIGLIMFPGAISAVVFGTVGGNLTDRKGGNFVVYLGLALLLTSLVAMAVFIGYSPWLISATLLLMYIGLSFVQTALGNSVSQTLEVSQTGVGMGLFNLVSIMSGAIGTALVARVLDKSLLNFPIFPFITNTSAYVYSNLMLVFTIIVGLGGCLYAITYGRVQKKVTQ